MKPRHSNSLLQDLENPDRMYVWADKVVEASCGLQA